MSDRTPRAHHVPEFVLESGEVLRDVRQAYFLDGELNADRTNLVVIFHALTGSADAAGEWWSAVVGPGKAIDTNRVAVLCTNLLGSCYGTTYAGDEPDAPRPQVTPRDMVRLIGKLVEEELRVSSVALAIGGSLGGMVALEWAATFPTLSRAVVCLAAPAAHTASAVAWGHIQRTAVEIGGEAGLALARMVAMMTYRTGTELESRFGRRRVGGRFDVERYLDYQGTKLVNRFTIRSYLTLVDAMDAHDVGRGRGGIDRALRRFEGRLVGVGIPGDLLYTDEDVRRWVDAARAEYHEIHSITGHDAFLLEEDQVSAIIRQVLDDVISPVYTGARVPG